MSAISITAANVLASSGATIKAGVAGATITQGQPVYLQASSGTYQLSDSNFAGAQQVDGIAITAASNGQPILVATRDPSFNIGSTVASGSIVMLSETTGSLTITPADLLTGDAIIVLGVALGTTGGTTSLINLAPVAGGVK